MLCLISTHTFFYIDQFVGANPITAFVIISDEREIYYINIWNSCL